MFTIWSYWPHTGVRTSDPGAMNFKILLKEFMDIIIMHFFFFFQIHITYGSKA